MSLHALAQDMSSKGRHGDSMLVHMSPNEVAGLHALALAHGEKLTINPQTGLPEAFSLKKLLPAVLGFALNTFAPGLGTAVGSMFGAGAVAGTAALVGAGYGLAKGSLREGLLAGLGAYGGAGLAQGLAASGANQIASEEVLRQQAGQLPLEGTSATEAMLGAPTTTTTTASTTGTAGAPAAGAESAAAPAQTVLTPVETVTPPVAGPTPDPGALSTAGYTPPTGLEALKRGAQSIYDQGRIGDFAKLNKNNLYAIGASAMLSPEDEEGMPETRRDGYIRPARYDWRTGKYEYFEPVKASEWGTRNLSEYTSASDPRARTPIGAKAGGLMALAGGGAIAFAEGGAPQFTVGEGASPDRTEPREPLNSMGLPVTPRPGEPGSPEARAAAYEKQMAELAARKAARAAAGEPNYNRFTVTGFGPNGVTHYDTTDPTYTGPGTGTTNPTPTTPTPTTPTPTTPTPTNPTPTNPTPTNPTPTNPTPTNPPPVYRPPTGPYNPPPPMPTTPDIKDVTTGGSRAAYEYLYGQGPYPTNPYLPEGTPIARELYKTPGYEALKPKPSASLYSTNPDVKPTGNPGSGMQWVWQDDNSVQSSFAKKGKWVAKPISSTTPTPQPEPPPPPPAGANGGMVKHMALGGLGSLAGGGSASQYNLGGYSDGGRLLRGPGDGVSDSIPATIGRRQPARLADGEFVVPARIVSELGNGSTEAGARKLYAMMDRVQRARGKTTGKKRVAVNSRADKYLPA
jgi:hypothetical protein